MISQDGFAAFATDFYSKHKYCDIRDVFAIAGVNKYCQRESYTSAIWKEIMKIYSSDDHVSREQLKTQIITDLTNVCWPKEKESIRISYESVTFETANHVFFRQPKYLGLDQISFIHALARSIYEHNLWLKVQELLKEKSIGTIENGPSTYCSSIRKLTAVQRNHMINFPREFQKDMLDESKWLPPVANLFKGVNRLSKTIDEWIKANKKNFPSITKFVFIGSRTSALPYEFFNLTGLEHLRLEKFKFGSLSPEIKKLKNLKNIWATSCSLIEFPKAICKLKELTSIHLGRNEISSIPNEIRDLSNLKSLLLNSNLIKNYNNSIRNSYEIHVNLKNNPIRKEDLPKNLRVKIGLSIDVSKKRTYPFDDQESEVKRKRP